MMETEENANHTERIDDAANLLESTVTLVLAEWLTRTKLTVPKTTVISM